MVKCISIEFITATVTITYDSNKVSNMWSNVINNSYFNYTKNTYFEDTKDNLINYVIEDKPYHHTLNNWDTDYDTFFGDFRKDIIYVPKSSSITVIAKEE